jgi:hypothetical protein
VEIPVYLDGRIRGSAVAARDGLYTSFTVTATQLPEAVYRVWAMTGDQRVYLGVLQPEGERWTMHKRLASRSLPGAVERCELLCEISHDSSDGWMPYTEELLGCTLPCAKYRTNQPGKEVIWPYDPQISCALVPLFCFFTMVDHDGQPHFRLLLDETGEPVLPDT